jgi:hypothetical protein
MASGGPGPYWGFETIRTVMARGKPLGGVAVVLAIGLVFLVLGVVGENPIVVAFGLGLLALGSSWLVNAYRRLAERPGARARDADR